MIRQRKARQVNIRQGKAMQRNAIQGNKKGKERQGEAIIKTRQGNARQRKATQRQGFVHIKHQNGE